MSAGVIINPAAGGRNEKGLALARMLEGSRDADVEVLERFEQLFPALERFAKSGIEALFISSGDGTVQEIQTRIAEDGRFAQMPALCLLPHGTTNMTAADLGFRSKSLRMQRDYIQFRGWRGQMAKRARRPTLRIANPADGKARHGMFLGGGAIAAATLYCQSAYNAKGVRGQKAALATFAKAAGKALFGGRARADDESRFDRPFPMTVRHGGDILARGDQLAILATTLEKLVLGARPFWGGRGGDVRLSLFGYPPPFLPRWLPFVLYGGEERKMPAGMTSLCLEAFEVETQSGFVLDGEPFDPPESAPLRVSRGADFTYLLG